MAGRPPIPVGSYGKINTRRISEDPPVWEAVALFRQPDGKTKQVRRRGPSKTKATNKIREKLLALATEATSGTVSPDMRFTRICDMWLAQLEQDYKLSGKSPQTPRLYAGYVRNWIKPALGELQCREVRAWNANRIIQRAREKSYETAKSVRTVLSAICAFAVRQGAMESNPVKESERLAITHKKEIKALTMEQRVELIEKLEKFAVTKATDAMGRRLGKRLTVWLDMPDIVRGMLCTGARVSELLALSGEDVDPSAPTVLFAHHLVRKPGVGVVRMENRKGNGSGLLLGVPQWSVPMWRRRKLISGGGPVFPSWNESWLDPGNTVKRIRQAMDECGYEWVTSHVWRKTVATVLDQADLPTTAIADQLGNTPAVVERHYRRKRVTNDANVAALEKILPAADA